MEKFGLLNLLKAIDGLKSAQPTEKEPPPEATSAPSPTQEPPQQAQSASMPNFMYDTLMRHETVSNRLKNKK